MSTEIDKQIVEMQFDNKNFEKGITTTINSIDTLKKSLNFDGVEKGFDKINAGFDGMKLGGVTTALDSITSKFSILGTVGDQVIRHITDSITSKLLTAFNEVKDTITGTKSMMEGFNEYELKIKSIQTIAANTGALLQENALTAEEEQAAWDIWQKGLYGSGEERVRQLEQAGLDYERVQKRVVEISQGIDKSTVTTMQDIDNALDGLNTYADKTIYNFAQMTDAIGKFTVAGVDLETSTEAVKGVANLAALSGADNISFQRSLTNISQALATGRMTLTDWKSIENARMNSDIFVQSIMETARVHNIAIDDMIAKEGAFRDTLSSGWLTNDIFIESLNKLTAFTEDMTDAEREAERIKWRELGYTEQQIKDIEQLSVMAYEAATKVRTFTQLTETLKEEIGSSYTMMWQNIIGDFNEATALWTGLHDTIEDNFIGPMTKAREEKWKYFHDNGGRDAMIKGLTNVGNSLLTLYHAIGDAWHSIFPKDDGTRITAIAKSFEKFSERLVISEETAEKIKITFQGMFSVLHIGYELVKAIAPYVLKTIGLILPKLLDLTAYIGKLLIKLDDFITRNEIFKNILSSIFGVLIDIGNVLGDIFTKIADFISKSKIGNIFNTILDDSKSFVVGVVNNINGINNEDLNGVESFGDKLTKLFGKIFDGIKSIFGKFSGIFGKIFDVFKKIASAIVSTIKAIVSNVDPGVSIGDLILGFFSFEVIKTLFNGINSFSDLIDGMLKTFSGISKMFSNIGNSFKNITDILSGVKDVLAAYTLEIKAEALKAIATSILMISVSLIALSLVDSNKLQSSIIIISETMGVLLVFVKAISEGSTNIKNAIVSVALITSFSLALLALVPVILLLGVFDETAKKGIEAMTKTLTVLLVAMVTMTKLTKDIKITQIISISLALISLVSALNLLLPSILILGLLPQDKVSNGIANITKLFTILIGSIALLFKTTKDIKISQLFEIILAMNELVLAINLLIIPLLILSFIPQEKLSSALISLIALMGSLVVAVNLLPEDSVKVKSLTKLAEALLILSVSLKILEDIPTEQLVTSAGALGLCILAISGAFIVADKVDDPKKVGSLFKNMASSILLLSVSLLLISKIDTNKILVSVGAIIALMGSMAIIAKLTSETKFDGLNGVINSISKLGLVFIEFSAASYLFAKAIDIISNVNFDNANYENFGLVLYEILAGIKEIIPELINLISELIVETLKAIRTIIPELIKTMFIVIDETLSALVEHLPSIVKNIVEIIIIILDTLKENIGPIVNRIIDVFLATIKVIASRMDDIVISLGNLLFSILEAAIDWFANDQNRSRLRSDIEMLIVLIVVTIGEFALDLFRAGKSLFDDFIDGLTGFGYTVGEKIHDLIVGEDGDGGIVGAFKRIISNAWEKLKDIGGYLVEGIWEGVKNAWDWLKSKVSSLCGSILDTMKSALDIFSPSKKTEEIGDYLVQGLIVGITGSRSALDKSISSLAKGVMDDFDSDLNTVTPTIVPVVNMDDLSYARSQLDGLDSSISRRMRLDVPSIEDSNNQIVEAITELRDEVSYLQDYISDLTVQMDTGALVGAIKRPMDQALGKMATSRKRGV